jgi:hypothetical protein
MRPILEAGIGWFVVVPYKHLLQRTSLLCVGLREVSHAIKLQSGNFADKSSDLFENVMVIGEKKPVSCQSR